MNNRKCKCGNELEGYEFYKCFKCRDKEDKQFVWFCVGLVVVIGLIIFAGKLVWAKYAYDDYRCVFSECRLLKD